MGTADRNFALQTVQLLSVALLVALAFSNTDVTLLANARIAQVMFKSDFVKLNQDELVHANLRYATWESTVLLLLIGRCSCSYAAFAMLAIQTLLWLLKSSTEFSYMRVLSPNSGHPSGDTSGHLPQHISIWIFAVFSSE